MEDLQLQIEVEGFEQEKEWRGWSWFPGAGQESGYGTGGKGKFPSLDAMGPGAQRDGRDKGEEGVKEIALVQGTSGNTGGMALSACPLIGLQQQ